MTKAKTPNPMQSKTPSSRQKTLSVRQRPQCMAKTLSARQNTLSVRQRLPVQRPPVQDRRLSVHGKDSQCKAQCSSIFFSLFVKKVAFLYMVSIVLESHRVA